MEIFDAISKVSFHCSRCSKFELLTSGYRTVFWRLGVKSPLCVFNFEMNRLITFPEASLLLFQKTQNYISLNNFGLFGISLALDFAQNIPRIKVKIFNSPKLPEKKLLYLLFRPNSDRFRAQTAQQNQIFRESGIIRDYTGIIGRILGCLS